jgi:hypothetical protein
MFEIKADYCFIIKTSFERLFFLSGGFRKSGGFQSFILEFSLAILFLMDSKKPIY